MFLHYILMKLQSISSSSRLIQSEWMRGKSRQMTQSLSSIKIRNSKRLPVPSENSLSRQEAACESSSENNSEEGWRERKERWENRQGTLIYIFSVLNIVECAAANFILEDILSQATAGGEREYDSVVFEREKEGKNPLTNFILCTHVFFFSYFSTLDTASALCNIHHSAGKASKADRVGKIQGKIIIISHPKKECLFACFSL